MFSVQAHEVQLIIMGYFGSYFNPAMQNRDALILPIFLCLQHAAKLNSSCFTKKKERRKREEGGSLGAAT